MRRPARCLAIAGLLCLTHGSQAQMAARVEAGKQIAQKFCARCHAIGLQRTSTCPGAPPFRVIVAKGNVENLKEALGEGIVAGHPAMPQFQFKPDDAGSLIAYLKSLSGRG